MLVGQQIRSAAFEDVETLSTFAAAIYTVAFGESFAPDDLAAHLGRNLSPGAFRQYLHRDIILLAYENDAMTGFVQFGPADSGNSNDREVRRLYVLPRRQNAGIGTQLMTRALEHPSIAGAGNIYLDVWEDNLAAQRLYARFGFAVIGTRPFAVASGRETGSDLIMVLRR